MKLKNLIVVSAIFFLVVLIGSCTPNTQKKIIDNNLKDTLPKGKIISKIVCVKDTSQSYALYLPSNYSENKLYPVVFCFDAHAGGQTAVEHLFKAAENFGYIVVGSNNAKNGLQTMSYTIDVFLNDVKQRFSIDKNRMYTAGFSGGARVAVSVAMYESSIRGVAGCGAGFPALNQPIQNKFCYVAMVGNEDFNYLEIIFQEQKLEQQKIPYLTLVFDGKHEWAPKDYWELALGYFQLDAMKNELIKKDKKQIKEIMSLYYLFFSDLETKSDLFNVCTILNQLIMNFENFIDTDDWKNIYMRNNSKTEFLNQKSDYENCLTLEMKLQQKYFECFESKDLNWWKKEVANFNDKIENENNSYRKLTLKRLFNYLSIVGFSKVNNAINQHNYQNAKIYLEIYKLVDPKNPDVEMFMEKLKQF